MKSFQRFGLALLLCSAIISCTKDIPSASTSNDAQAARTQVLGGNNANNNNNNANKTVKLTPSQSPVPVNAGTPVTITYSVTDAVTDASVSCGKIMIYQLINGIWTEVAVANAPAASFTFTPTNADDCAYQFKAGFAPGAGAGGTNCAGSYAGLGYETQTAFCADVQVPCVSQFTIQGNATAVAVPGTTLYEFTITYTLTSPVAVNGVKFQGGATAGGNSGHQVTDYGNTTLVNLNNNNTVVKWEGNLVACVPQTVTFKYTRNFSCPATAAAVTGNWSAKQGDTELGSIAPLTYSCQ